MEYFEENENGQLTINDMVNKMEEYCGEEAYSNTYMKKKIQEHFGDSIRSVFCQNALYVHYCFNILRVDLSQKNEVNSLRYKHPIFFCSRVIEPLQIYTC